MDSNPLDKTVIYELYCTKMNKWGEGNTFSYSKILVNVEGMMKLKIIW